jgi:cytochrome c-type biogenesis protein CcmE
MEQSRSKKVALISGINRKGDGDGSVRIGLKTAIPSLMREGEKVVVLVI